MRYKIFLIFATLFLITASFSNLISAEEVNYSYSYDYEGTQFTLLKYEPYPVNPGDYFNVWIKVSLGNDINYAKFELVDSFPFSIDNSENRVREYDSAESREIVMQYKVRVNENAVEGVNELKLKIDTNKVSSQGEIIKVFEIYVDNAQTDFDLVVQDTSESEISLAIANIGKNTANSMIVRIPEQESYQVKGTNGQMVGNLESGDYTIVSFEVSQTSRNSEDPLKIQIDYTDNIGERRSITKEINFISGSIISNSSSEEMRNGFERGNFPGQKKITIWPYILLAIGLLIAITGFFVYKKNHKKINNFLKNKFSKKKIKKSDEKKTDIPEWMLHEVKKIKKR